MAKARTKTITERFAFSGGKVVREGAYPVIKDVLLCGPISANKRRYAAAAFGKADTKLYEGRPVYLNHSTGNRKFEDKLGWIENERRRADGMPVGDIGINPKHSEAESVLWAAEHKPDFAGMSHVAECESDYGRDGWEDVKRVVSVESSDLVVDPATTKGFHESKGSSMNKIKFAKLIESIGAKLPFKKLLAAKRLAEMDGVGDMEVDAPADDAPAAASVLDALKTLIASVVDEVDGGKLELEAGLAKISDFLNAHMGSEPDEDDEDGDEEETPTEAKKKKKAAGLTAEAVAKIVADEIAKLKVAPVTEEKPKSGGKAAPKTEASAAVELTVDDRKKLKESLKA